MIGSKSLLTVAGVLLAGSVLSGCVGGTTYGTGVSQEQQTIEDLANILTLTKKDKPRIEYQNRPDLVVPEQKVLVSPKEEAQTNADSDWPETPEQRIARVRAEAEEAQATVAGQNAFAKRQKTFRKAAEPEKLPSAAPGEGIPNVSCDPEGKIMRRCTPFEISKAVRSQRAEIKSVGKTGYKRRYLTEPPIEYRTPSQNAPIGDDSYSEKELAEIKRLRKQEEVRLKTSGAAGD